MNKIFGTSLKLTSALRESRDLKEIIDIENSIITWFVGIISSFLVLIGLLVNVFDTQGETIKYEGIIIYLVITLIAILVNKIEDKQEVKLHLTNLLSAIIVFMLAYYYYSVLGIVIWTVIFFFMLIAIIRVDQSMIIYVTLSGVLADSYLYITYKSSVFEVDGDFYLKHIIAHIIIGILSLFVNKVFRDSFKNTVEQNHEINQYVKQIKENEEMLHKMAYYDTLTGLPNRKMMNETLDKMFKECNKNYDCFAVVFIDLDDFKEINDDLGHIIGDKFLVQVARRFEENLKEGDIISRFGGDEFTLIIDYYNDKEELESYVTNLCTMLNQDFIVDGYTLRASGCFGIALYSEHSDSITSLLSAADKAMYRAKKNGKNQVSF